ncbi:MAG: head-tail connector protein [Desulfovibrio sp.]|nr:head-tail connector protein [Desulfovibrio sp.]
MAVDIERLNVRYESLRNERAAYDTAWRDLAEHFLPTRFKVDTDTSTPKPEILNRKVVDTTGIIDMGTLAAGMQGGMSSPARPWFKLGLSGVDELGEDSEASAWLDEVTERMRILLHRSNFYNAAHALYGDLGTFGPGLLIETADWDGLHFRLIPCGEYVLDVDEKGDVDTFMYRTRMTARQILQKFEEKNIPAYVVTAAKTPSNVENWFDVIHAVFPRSDRAYGSLKGKDMPWASVWWLRGGSAHTGVSKTAVLRESGFQDFPAFAPRWDTCGIDKYGRSPAMNVLPDCRMLQQMGATTLKSMHKAVDPPIIVPARAKAIEVMNVPGGVTYFDPLDQNMAQIQPLHQVNPQLIAAAEEKIKNVQQKVHDGLFADLFKMLIMDDRRQITATEIEAREREKLILLGPVVDRLDREFLSPLIKRTFSLMMQYDFLPEPPETIAGADLKVEFVSVMAQAQKLVSTSPLDQTMVFVSGLAKGAPDVLDNINTDVAVRMYADKLGAPASLLRSEEEVEVIRKQRAEAQQMAAQEQQTAQGVANMEGMSNAAKNLGATPVGADGQTAMDALLGGLGGM